MAQKPGIPKGTRDFSPETIAKRDYIIHTIKKQFQLFGFQPIETPSFENSETLLGKYGEEGDRLIFKVLDSGEYFEKAVKGNYLGETQFAYLHLHLYDSLKIIFKEILEKDNMDEYENMVKSQFVEGKSGFHVYINDKGLLSLVKDFLISYSDFFKEHLKDIIKMAGNSDEKFNHYFNAFYRANFLGSNYYEELIDIGDNLLDDMKSKELSHLISDHYEKLADTGYNNLFDNIESKKLSNLISGKALRYDLTVPFARYVVMHQNEITFPFKRYQIQPVWRADRPQKGRYREFYQCDADVVGSASLWQEVEFVQLYDAVFSELNIEGVSIKINNRKILSGIAQIIGAGDQLIDFTVALDKLDKVGEEGVKKEMLTKGLPAAAIEKLQPLFNFKGNNREKLQQLKTLLAASEEGTKGVEELEFILNAVEEIGLQSASITLDVTLARGLNYYTGAIFEVAAPPGIQLGSVGGGGRYDDLTGIFGLRNVSGVGISFGLDRIYLVLEALNLFPDHVESTADVLFINFGAKEALQSLRLIKELRMAGITAHLYPDAAKMKKQLQYANKCAAPFVVLIGAEELKKGTFVLKNMKTGDQETHPVAVIATVMASKKTLH